MAPRSGELALRSGELVLRLRINAASLASLAFPSSSTAVPLFVSPRVVAGWLPGVVGDPSLPASGSLMGRQRL